MNVLRRSLATDVAAALATGMACYALCRLGLSFDVTAGASSVWPASGLLTGLVLVSPRHRWRAIAVGALIAGVAANLAIGLSGIPSVGFTLINLGQSFAAALMVSRFAPAAIRLRQPGDVMSLLALGAAVAAVGATLAATLASLTAGVAFWNALGRWIAAGVTGIVTVAPVALAAVRHTEDARSWTPDRVAECAVMLTIAAAASWWIFFSPHATVPTPLTQPFPLLLCAVWAAIRFGVPGTIGLRLVLNGLCLWGTSLGLGPYAAGDTLQAFLTAHVFAVAVSVFFLSLSTSIESTQRSMHVQRELASQLQSAADAERSRLAHELHDDVAQKLAALKMQLELDRLLEREGRSSDEFVSAVDHLIADVRALSRAMRPAPFEEGQLIPALATLARTEGRRAGLRVLVETGVGDVRLSRDVELACYRVVREAVTNIVKHARAHHLAVSALTSAGVFAVRVVDDGTGFDVAPAARQAALDGHLGLMGMQERVEQVGGTLRIRSRRGGGTMVECRVPLMTTV